MMSMLFGLYVANKAYFRYLFGYLCKREEIVQSAKTAMESVIFNKKLPLVLDLDDTLVRLVGDGNDRHVPESEAHRCKSILSLLSNKLTWANL